MDSSRSNFLTVANRTAISYSTSSNLEEALLEAVKYPLSLAVSVGSLIAATSQNYAASNDIVLSYIYLDLFFLYQLDMFIHHILTLSLLLGNAVMNTEEPSYFTVFQTLTNVEISTIFLSTYWMTKKEIISLPKPIVVATKILFAASFFKYRLWDYYFILLAVPLLD